MRPPSTQSRQESPVKRILIADDHEVVRTGLKQMLTDEFGRVTFGEAPNEAETLRRARQEKWDLVLLDITMPGRSGLEALAELKKARPRLPVLVLSMFAESEYAVRALKSGAAGYVCKQSVGRELLAAVKQALGGGRYVSPALAQVLAEDLSRPADKPLHATLSDREFAVMQMIATGRSVKEIAGSLSLSPKTVFTYRARLLAKLRVKSDVEVARYALQHRLVE
jgi:two-component system invasion response regulator UvrY